MRPILKLFSRLFQTRPFADATLCHFLRRRLSLPKLALSELFDDFDGQPVILRKIPRGGWSTPTQDLVILLKLVLCARPKLLMEIGSFRGYTALLLAQHTGQESRVVTVDRFPEHGEAYGDTPEVSRIDRRVGETAPALFANDKAGSFDLIFIDADHTYQGVRNDTELMLPLVSQRGCIVWHDYANWGYFNRYNGVPEYLKELSASLPIAQVSGSDMAIYSPSWATAGSPERERYLRALATGHSSEVGGNPWRTTSLR